MSSLSGAGEHNGRCRVIYLLDRLGSGGIAQMILNTMGAIDRTVIEPIVVLTRQSPSMDHLERLEKLGIEVVQLGRTSRYDLAAWRRLLPVLRTADVLHSHGVMSNQWGRLWGRVTGVPVITHNHTAASVKPGLVRLIDRLMWRFSARVVAVSDHDRRMAIQLEGVPESRIVRVYNGVDSVALGSGPERAKARQRLDLDRSRFVISMVGRLVDEKNHDGAISAIELLPEDIKEKISLLIVGDGLLRSELEATVASRLSDVDVRFLGQRPDVPWIFAATDLLLMPSHTECLPMTVLEAVATGCPVVATPVGGVPEALDGVGWPMASASDPRVTAGAVEEIFRICAAKRDRRVNAGLERAHSTFDSSVTAGQLKELYLDVVAENTSA